MPKLTICKTCKNEISKSTKACPHCGEKNPQGGVSILGVLLALALGCGILSSLTSNDRPRVSLDDQASSVPSDPNNGWTLDEDTSDMNDSKIVVVNKDAVRPISAWMRQVTPVLVIRCKEGKTEVIFDAKTHFNPEIDNYSRSTIRVRLDEKPARKEVWNEGTSGESLFATRGQKLAKEIYNAKRLRIEFSVFNVGNDTAEFDLTGAQKMITKVASACSWKP